MVPPAAQSEKLAVQHVRKPGYGEPVGRFAGAERPFETGRRDTAADVNVARHVLGIVEIDELKPPHGSIQHDGRNEKSQRDPLIEPGITRWPWFRMPNARFLRTVLQKLTFSPSCTARPPPTPLTPVPLPRVEVT